LVGSSEAKKVPGLVRFVGEIFYRVCELPSPRNAQERDKKIKKKSKKLKKSQENISGLVGCSKANQIYVGVRRGGVWSAPCEGGAGLWDPV
jgi:hypothetical protein